MLSLEGYCTAQPELPSVVEADRPTYMSEQARLCCSKTLPNRQQVRSGGACRLLRLNINSTREGI